MPNHRPDACEVVHRHGGAATWDQLLQHTTSHSVRKALHSGQLRRAGHGVYALPETSLAQEAAATTRGLVSHGSAARHWLMESLTRDLGTHITVPGHSRPRPIRGVTLHYSDVNGIDDHGGVTSPLRTVLDCALTLPFPDALAIADSALRRDLITPEQLVAAAAARPRNGRHLMLRVAAAADGRAANPFESGLRAAVIEAGLTGFEPQHLVKLPRFDAYLDLGDEHLRIALEADSFIYHGTPEGLRRDCHRYNELVRADWLVLRFTWDDVAERRSELKSVLLDTCAMRRTALQERSQPRSVLFDRAPDLRAFLEPNDE